MGEPTNFSADDLIRIAGRDPSERRSIAKEQYIRMVGHWHIVADETDVSDPRNPEVESE